MSNRRVFFGEDRWVFGNRENHSRKKSASGETPPVATFDRQFTVRESFECITYNSVNINFRFPGKKEMKPTKKYKIERMARVRGLMKAAVRTQTADLELSLQHAFSK